MAEKKDTPKADTMYEVELSKPVMCGGFLLRPKDRHVLSADAIKECGDAIVKYTELKK